MWRTISVMAAQLFLAYFIPEILEGMNQGQPYFAKDLKYFWPLNYYFFEDWHLNNMTDQASGSMGMFYMVWGILGFTVLTPIITYYVGKRCIAVGFVGAEDWLKLQEIHFVIYPIKALNHGN